MTYRFLFARLAALVFSIFLTTTCFALDHSISADFDGDGKADPTVWRYSDGGWYVHPSSGTCPSQMTQSSGGCFKQWGLSGDKPMAGDFAGANKNDFAVYRPSNKTVYISYSYGGTATVAVGSYMPGVLTNGDIPAPGDYTGDGRTDIAFMYHVQVDNSCTPYGKRRDDWFIRDSTTLTVTNYTGHAACFPNTARHVVSADYNNDGVSDRAVGYQANSSVPNSWYEIVEAYGVSTRSFLVNASGLLSYPIIIEGDYTGDGLPDYVFIDTPSVTWTIFPNGSSSSSSFVWGLSNDNLVPGDFDGDGINDPAVWRPSNGTWYVKFSSLSTCPSGWTSHYGGCALQWGLSGDVPVPYEY